MIINPIIYGSALQTHNTTYLYYRGDECEDITGGWSQTNYNNDASYSSGCHVWKGSWFMQLDTKYSQSDPTPTDKYACITTENVIDASSYVSWGAATSFFAYGSASTMSIPKIGISTNRYISSGADSASQYTAVLSQTYNAPTSYERLSYSISYPMIGYNETASIHTLNMSPCKSGYITVMAFYSGQVNNLSCVYLAKHDNLAPLSQYGISIDEILSNAEELLNDPVAVSRMVRYCTGDFMWAALLDSSFRTALLNSPYSNYVFRNEEWGKACATILNEVTNLLFDSDGEFLMDSEGYLLYSTS